MTSEDLQSPIGLQSLFGDETGEAQKITVSHSSQSSSQKKRRNSRREISKSSQKIWKTSLRICRIRESSFNLLFE